MTTPDRGNPIRSLWRSSRSQVLIGLAILIAVGLWLAPRRIDRVVTIGGQDVWHADAAPSIREIVWQSPEPLVGIHPERDADQQSITPFLTDNGATLYFGRREPDGQTDIFVSRLRDGTWQPPEPLLAVNSPFDDLGPVVSADGSSLYFCSNRPGGWGGTDLWVSRKTNGRWSEPVNLGPEVNSPFDELDPALTPDGQSLFFASNRNDDPVPEHRADGEETAPWTTTLRARSPRTSFDLYQSRRDEAGNAWQSATAVAAVNEPDSSEGAAFVSADGVYLYFASDRESRKGEPANLDLYRARLHEETVGTPHNLGSGINTSADETEPGLSPEGFTLVFSSNRDGVDRVYGSRAREITRDVVWDTSHLARFRNGWLLVSVLLSAALLAWLILQRRRIWERVWPARFFLGSVLINCVLLFLLAAWKFPEVLDVVVRTFDDSIPAPELLDESEHQSHEDGREAYEKVADLKSIDAEAIPEVVRRVTEAASVAERTERLVPTVPADVAAALPPERVVFIPPKEVVVKTTPTDSPLRRTPVARPVEMAAVSDLPDIELPSESAPQEQAVEQQETAVAAAERPNDQAALELSQAAETNETPQPKAVALQEVQQKPVVNPPPRPLPDVPMKRQPRTRTVAVVAAIDPAEADAPAGASAPQDEAVDPQDASLTKAAATPDAAAAAAVSAVTTEAPPATQPATITPKNPSPREALTTAQQPVENPLTQRKPAPRVTTAVALLDNSLPEVLAAEETGVVPTVDGTRPQFERSAASTRPPPPPAPSEGAEPGPPARASALRPAAASIESEILVATAEALDNPLAKPIRKGQTTEAVLVAAVDRESVELSPVDDIPDEESVDAAEAVLGRKPDAAQNADAPRSVALAGNLPDLQAAKQTPLRRIRKRPDDAVASADVPRNPMLKRRPMAEPASASPPVTGDLETTDAVIAAVIAVDELVESSEAPLNRAEDPLVTSNVPTPRELTGPATRVQNRIIVGELSEQQNNAPPAFSPIASRLNRKRAKAMKVALAEDNVGLQALLTLRQGDTRRQHIQLLGGSDESEKAVNLGLDWLAKVQEPDGSWNLQKHQGSVRSFTAGTGLGLLPFLAAGYTHNIDGKYKDNVARAVKWLVDHQNKETGDLLAAGDAQRMYSHGIAAIALCEAFGMSQDPELREPAQKALTFIINAQHKPSGGWRYNPNEHADTSVVGWQMMALKSGEMAGLQVPSGTYQLVAKWFDAVEAKVGPGGTFGYQNRSATAAMTAEGLLCLQFMGTNRNSPKMRFGADFLLKQLPQENQSRTSYYWYYATQVMYHMQGEYWEKWNVQTRDLLVRTQHKSGGNAGTWDSRDNWERSGGRVYATSLKLLMLEVYYRHLPLYDQLEL